MTVTQERPQRPSEPRSERVKALVLLALALEFVLGLVVSMAAMVAYPMFGLTGIALATIGIALTVAAKSGAQSIFLRTAIALLGLIFFVPAAGLITYIVWGVLFDGGN